LTTIALGLLAHRLATALALGLLAALLAWFILSLCFASVEEIKV